jgi:hypothetical protein
MKMNKKEIEKLKAEVEAKEKELENSREYRKLLERKAAAEKEIKENEPKTKLQESIHSLATSLRKMAEEADKATTKPKKKKKSNKKPNKGDFSNSFVSDLW